MQPKIPFNKPHLTGKEAHYLYQAVCSGKISGDGMFTKKCHDFFKDRYGFKKCLLTTSCTDALEMAALLLDIQPGDEVILPSYTFVSTANAFVLRGATLVFADSKESSPNMDEASVERLVNSNTKAIVPVHYGGVGCDMDAIMDIAEKYGVFVVEDAAQAIDSFYKGRALGSIGHLGAFSFHETKNIISGEGGMLAVNDERFAARADILWEKGTTRVAFFKGEVDKYGWVDIGSSFLPSDIIAAFLYAQLENLDDIQWKRKKIWQQYADELGILEERGCVRLPFIDDFAHNNAHVFYIVCNADEDWDGLLTFLKKNGVWAVFHYLSLHKSPFFESKHDGRDLRWSDFYSRRLIRLPFYYQMGPREVSYVCGKIKDYFSV